MTTTTAAAVAAKATVPAAASSLSSLGGMLFALLLVLGLIFALAWLLRRLSGAGVRHPGSLQVVTSLAVGPKQRLLVVAVGDKQLVLGVTAQQISLLHELAVPLPTPAAGENFATLLARRLGRGGS